ncbi:hypothetical protein [Vibrio harveyi]|uniref:hypothetical protein n=1 Tax=Vibrio harveyi TaxID=669 RepID=UPI002380C120|nr:hypothetical protein [Vibrio harveyi]
MSWGALLRNSQGQEIQYGAEAIPVCLAAFDFNLTTMGIFEKTLNIPFQTDVALFVRSNSVVANTPVGNFPAHVAGMMGFPSCVNSGGKLKIKMETLSPQDFDQTSQYPPQWWVGSGRLYVVGRQPNIAPTGKWGMVIYDEHNRVAFSTDSTMAPINQVVVGRPTSFPTYTSKTASLIAMSGNGVEGPINAGIIELYRYYFISSVMCRDGRVRPHLSGKAITPMRPGSDWGKWHDNVALVTMDTTYADRQFFNE